MIDMLLLVVNAALSASNLAVGNYGVAVLCGLATVMLAIKVGTDK